ncbi:zinc finger protein 2-like [Ixodes scapularis]|uniref:zinc finger protein 2-like n=1 Tax=Ixodes scapularis TaxID=6945 RepID=UPI001A9E2369|nr:zinc finger protein 2-like [Ixodes scapularis]
MAPAQRVPAKRTSAQAKRSERSSDPKECTFGCADCSYNTNRQSNLQRHRTAKHQPFAGDGRQCCGQAFRDQFSLDQHKGLVHLADRSYRCLLCPERFDRAGVLGRHMFTHSGEKRFFCQVCPYKSPSKYNVERHQEARHGVVKNRMRRHPSANKNDVPPADKDSGSVPEEGSYSRSNSAERTSRTQHQDGSGTPQGEAHFKSGFDDLIKGVLRRLYRFTTQVVRMSHFLTCTVLHLEVILL